MENRKITSMVSGLGAAVPEKILTNHELAGMVDTSDEWIRTRTGIRERHVAEDGKATSDYAAEAAQLALKQANLPAEELDMIIFGTVTPDMYFPSAACFLQEVVYFVFFGRRLLLLCFAGSNLCSLALPRLRRLLSVNCRQLAPRR